MPQDISRFPARRGTGALVSHPSAKLLFLLGQRRIERRSLGYNDHAVKMRQLRLDANGNIKGPLTSGILALCLSVQ